MQWFLLLAFSASVAAHYAATDASFTEWRQKFGASYGSAEETAHRFSVWKSNLEAVQSHNLREARGEETYRMGMNKHADMTNAEYREFRLRPRIVDSSVRPPSFDDAAAALLAGNNSLPASVNWVDHGMVTKVKDQGQCGSCWAFSAVAAMEGAYNQAHQATGNGVDPSCTAQCGPKNVTCCSFSEQEVADCTLDGHDTCKKGGEPHDGILDVVARHGDIATEAAYPYVSGKTQKLTRCSIPSQTVSTGITGYVNVTSGDEDALAAAIATHAVVSVGIDASSFGFQLYDSGVYTDSECGNTPKKLDHGVAVVGYGTGDPKPPGPLPPPPGPADCDRNFRKPMCLKEKGCHWCVDSHKFGFCFNEPCPSLAARSGGGKKAQDYWLVKNSWGLDWGMGGYIAMARNHKNMCGIATDAVFATIGK